MSTSARLAVLAAAVCSLPAVAIDGAGPPRNRSGASLNGPRADGRRPCF